MATNTNQLTPKNIRRRKRSLESKQKKYGYIFTSPFIVGAIIFILIPLVYSVIYSFHKVELSPEVGKGLICVDGSFGLDNYNEIFNVDPNFRKQILASLGDMAINVPVVVIFSFFMASVLNTKFMGRGFARSVMFLPVIISSGVIISLTQNDLAAQLIGAGDRFASTADSSFEITGAFEMMLMQMDLPVRLIEFLIGAVGRISEITTMGAVSIVIFLAGLQSISPSIYEASYIEGATKWEVFWKISLPMVSPLILLSVVYTVVDSFTSNVNAVIRNIHQTIIGGTYDVGAAMAVSYSLIILAILGIVFAVLSKVVFYQD
ncbi:MAG: sugar ABC transporter permease [Clostridia bacterium]|nr:sugar ABC transporter permease [Clostridia bacterium]